MVAIGDCLLQINSETSTEQHLKTSFKQLLKINLWGNKCDLSLSVGQQVSVNALDVFNSLDDNILSDHSDEIWDCINNVDNSLIGELLQLTERLRSLIVFCFRFNSRQFWI